MFFNYVAKMIITINQVSCPSEYSGEFDFSLKVKDDISPLCLEVTQEEGCFIVRYPNLGIWVVEDEEDVKDKASLYDFLHGEICWHILLNWEDYVVEDESSLAEYSLELRDNILATFELI